MFKTTAEAEHAAAEINIFKENMANALKFLKHQSPLFLVIGADSAGKSSLLAHADLGLIDAEGQTITNPMSTRYCHFWFSGEEIFVDTAGSYTTASSSNVAVNSAWRGLIKLLNNYKRRVPLSGLIVVVDLPALASDALPPSTSHSSSAPA